MVPTNGRLNSFNIVDAVTPQWFYLRISLTNIPRGGEINIITVPSTAPCVQTGMKSDL